MKSKQKTRLVVVKSGEICYKSDKDAEVPKRMLSGSVHLPQGGNNCFGGGQCRALKSPLNDINCIKMWSTTSPGESGFHSHAQASEEGKHRSLQETKRKVAGASSTRPGAPLRPPPADVGKGKLSTRCTRWNRLPQQAVLRPSVLCQRWRTAVGTWVCSVEPHGPPAASFLISCLQPPKKSIFLKPRFVDPAKTSSGPAE